MLRFPLSLSDSQWDAVCELLPPKTKGRYSMRELFCAMVYISKTGCQWRNLPPHFPPWPTVYYHFRRLTSLGLWSSAMLALSTRLRIRAARAATPSAAIIDSQSVRTGAGVSLLKGWDGAKKLNGRKRHLITDTLGLPLTVMVSAASMTDRAALLYLSDRLQKNYPGLRVLFADRAYRGINLTGPIKTVVVQRSDAGDRWKPKPSGDVKRTFEPVPKRWIVERTFGWLVGYRRLVRDYEKLPACSAAFIAIAFITICMNKLTAPF